MSFPGGYKKVVCAYNTVDVTIECQMHVGGRAAFFRDGGRRYLQNAAGCLEACERLFAIWESSGAYNTIGINVGAYNTVCVKWLQSTVPYRVWSLDSGFDL